MNNEFNFLIYAVANEEVRIDVVVKDENILLTQKGMAELFDVKIPSISKHLKNIFTEKELQEAVVISKMEITTAHGAIEHKTHQDYVMHKHHLNDSYNFKLNK